MPRIGSWHDATSHIFYLSFGSNLLGFGDKTSLFYDRFLVSDGDPMNNIKVAEILEQTALLLEYQEGYSYMAGEFLRTSDLFRRLEVPIEVFENAASSKQDEHELRQMLGYWLRNASPDLLWCVQEVITTGSCRLRDRLLRETSPSVVGLLRLRTLSAQSINFIRERLRIRNIAALKKACEDRFLSRSGEFSEDEELDIFEEILRIEESDSKQKEKGVFASGDEILTTLDDSVPDDADAHTMFWANADALADFIIKTLSEPLKPTIKQTVGDFVSSNAIESVKEQALGVLGKVKRFFVSRDSSKYAQMRMQEAERTFEHELRRASDEIESSLSTACSEPLRVEKVGAVRRGQDALSRLDFLICTDEPKVAFERIKKSDFVENVLTEEARVLSVVLRQDSFTMPYNNRPTPAVVLYFYAASEFAWGTVQVALTSKTQHWSELKRRATLRGFTLTPFGLYDGAKRISSRTVERLYSLLSLPVIPEELREGICEWDWIDSGSPRLIALDDVKGDLHMHTTFTDGSADVEEMAVVARSLGLSYIAVTDHTKNVASVGGMNDVEFLRYWDYVDDFNRRLKDSNDPFRVLKGAEVDILEDGGLDLADETLAKADWVVASIHFGKRQAREQIHRRYLDAFRNPYVDVIAHPTGRMIGVEEGIDVDFEFLCENAKKYGKFLELNSQPRRLDLKVEPLVLAKKYGVPIVISTDAHAPEQLPYLRFGVLQAFRAGLTPDDVLNTLTYKELLRRLDSKKNRSK